MGMMPRLSVEHKYPHIAPTIHRLHFGAGGRSSWLINVEE